MIPENSCNLHYEQFGTPNYTFLAGEQADKSTTCKCNGNVGGNLLSPFISNFYLKLFAQTNIILKYRLCAIIHVCILHSVSVVNIPELTFCHLLFLNSPFQLLN